MFRQAVPYLWLVLLTSLLWSCNEEYSPNPPFTQANDTLFIDQENWVFTSQEAVNVQNATAYPFSYFLLGENFDGYLLSTGTKIYMLDQDEAISQKNILVDFSAKPGDTLSQISSNRYQLVLDRKFDPETDGEIFYILRRSLKGFKSWRERSVWIISPKKGVIGAASYSIDFRSGGIIPEMVGKPKYFRNPDFTQQIKKYDYNKASLADLSQKLIYEFDKRTGILKVKSYKNSQDLYQYEFDANATKDWMDFKLERSSTGIKLNAGADCYFFSQELSLERIDTCQ
ncbi:MAG: hypothetical protein MRZ79_23275 [Bacteroidia bacterium]|nr:hypothetical protein [Bacteroidia bacterium]